MALRWPWPENWIKYMSWLFAFNLDAWEISKVSSNMTYKSVQEFSSDSTLMLFSYWHFLVALGTLLFCLALAYVVAYIVLSKRDDPFMMIKISNLQRVYIIMIQVNLILFIIRVIISSVLELNNNVCLRSDSIFMCSESPIQLYPLISFSTF